ncbi:TIGR04222 domain-containing membrane protein [Gemmata sp. JC673]|uniref:TIGR04222 domain-containing membrane protein n=1 Tax=Gemmata algarum TaxID=2975278 RepID=A0ABU5F4Z8_9BACT|nr:TIGR04222 domain-containing membrane protein [Gemmata algarum]MDY3562656.1 TIGR04222 domain-containing membrane protein [Gemmata algarum]
MSRPLVPAEAELLGRLLAFDIDGGAVALPFAARLAREHGWSRSYAERVIEEYKRYVFLAATAGFKVCPSEDVDAAWHLHLTYTKSYWQRLCGELIGRPLHHEPTTGGPAEGEKHLRMYAATLGAYEEAFGRPPPADVWPDADARFGDDTRHRVVNTARNWVIPKAPIKRAAGLAAGFVLVAVLLPGCDDSFNPFALKRADILFPLVLSLVAAVCGGRVIRSVLRTPNATPGDDAVVLNWEQTAYLGGGTERLTTAALARVVGRGLAEVAPDGKTLRAVGPPPEDASAVERAVLGSLPVSNELAALKPVELAVGAAFAQEAERLARDGVTLPVARKIRIALASLLPFALVYLCLVLPQFVFAVWAGRSVFFLVIVSVGGGVVGLATLLSGSLRLTNRGRAVLAKQRTRHETLKSAARWESTGDVGMAVALFGTAVLAGTAVAPLQAWYPRQTGEASPSGCSSGCGSGCGGGDGGGGCGGGCGGGGD